MVNSAPPGSADQGEIYFSQIFKIDPKTLEAHGAFDISLLTDLPLFIDPFLLFNSKKPTYQALHQEIIRYLTFLRDKSATGALNRGLLEAWFTFHEVKENWFGYCRLGNRGSGLGPKFARALDLNLNTVFRSFGQETVTRGSHLEKLCLIADGVGKDNISDFTTTLIKEFLLRYTEAFAQTHIPPAQRRRSTVEKVRFNYETETWERDSFDLPWFRGAFVLLTPKDLLTKEEIWINRPELLRRVQDIAQALPNEALRAQVNSYFAKFLSKKPTEEQLQKARAATLLEFPQIIEHYIREKEDSGDVAESVSDQRVREAVVRFHDEVQGLRARLRTTPFYDSHATTLEEARKRVEYLKHVIEERDGYRFFYVGGQPITREKDIQIMYDLTWFGSVFDVNREANNGRGPVDFKISRGAGDASLVEFKLGSNTQLKGNLQKQVEIYQKAARAPEALKVITYFSESELRRVQRILRELKIERHPDIILVDARADNKPAASKA
jgi:hypothetical protein